MKRAILIGGNGFIGGAIRRRLAAQSLPAVTPSSAELNLAEPGSSDQLTALVKPDDTVVVLAAITPDKGRDAAALMRNLAIMSNVCAAVGRSGCAHLVYFSSDAVYNPALSRVDEETPAAPQDLYGAMHCTREIMARGLAKVPALVLRPTLVYGADDSHNSYGPNRFRRAAQKDGRIALFGNGEERRDHIHVDDVAEITVRCLLARRTGMLNIATGTSKSFREIAEIVARQFSRPVAIEPSPRANPITHRHYDVTALIKAFPDLRFIAPEEGIAQVHRQTAEAG